jgi:hypothetical protein
MDLLNQGRQCSLPELGPSRNRCATAFFYFLLTVFAPPQCATSPLRSA